MDEWIKGMDLSSLPQVEACGGRFFDGERERDAMEILRDCGMNFVRLRLWNDPKSPSGEPYGGGNTDFDRLRAMAIRCRTMGIPWLLDFHYSDCWADPGKQRLPKAWRAYDLPQLEAAVFGYTQDILRRLAAEDLLPAMVAPGNELTAGLLWPLGRTPERPEADLEDISPDPEGFAPMVRLVSAGIRAVRQEAPEAEIMLHLDNGGCRELYRWWFDSWLAAGGADFDVIGLSYYPFWHGSLEDLRANLRELSLRYDRDLIVAETSMGFSLDSYRSYEKLPESLRKGMAANQLLAGRVPYTMTPGGQAEFLRDLMRLIRNTPGNHGRGFFYWEPALLPVPGTDWATEAGTKYLEESGPGGNEWANQALFDYEGRALPALAVIRDFLR